MRHKTVPGSLKLVLKRLDNVKTNVRPDTTGMRTETFSKRYGQSKAKNRRLVAAMRKKVR